MSKLINMNYMFWLPSYTKILINNASYHILGTAVLPFLSKQITSVLTAVKDHVIKYGETAFSKNNVHYLWSIKNPSGVIEKLRLRNFQGSQVSSFDFSTLYISLPYGKGVWEGGQGGATWPPPHFQKWGAQVGLCPPPAPLLGRANVLCSLFAHILWLKTKFFQNFLGSLRSPTLINQYFLNFANLKL